MFFAGLAVGILLFVLIFALLCKFRSKWIKKLADKFHLSYMDNNRSSKTEKRRTYSLREPQPVPSDSPVILRRRPTNQAASVDEGHVTIQSLYSSPCDAKLNERNVMLQSLYSVPRDVVRNGRDAPPKPRRDDRYSKNPDDIHPGEPNVILPPFRSETSLEENPYSVVQRVRHRNPDQVFYLAKWDGNPHSAPSLNRRSNEKDRLSGDPEVPNERRLSAFKAYRRSTCPELQLRQQYRDSGSRPESESAGYLQIGEVIPSRKSDRISRGQEEPLYYTLENVTPLPIFMTKRQSSSHCGSRDSQSSTLGSSGPLGSFQGRISTSLSERVLSECKFLWQTYDDIPSDQIEGKSKRGSGITTRV